MLLQVLAQALLEFIDVVDRAQVVVDFDHVGGVAGRERHAGFHAILFLRQGVALDGAQHVAVHVRDDGHLHDMPPPCRLWKQPPTPWLWMLTK
jgi:hypothetical protein